MNVGIDVHTLGMSQMLGFQEMILNCHKYLGHQLKLLSGFLPT